MLAATGIGIALVSVWPTAGAGTATTATTAGFAGGPIAAASVCGGEDGEFLLEFCGAALRALCAFPIAGTHKEFAVFPAFFAMKLVDRHGTRITLLAKSSSVKPGLHFISPIDFEIEMD